MVTEAIARLSSARGDIDEAAVILAGGGSRRGRVPNLCEGSRGAVLGHLRAGVVGVRPGRVLGR